MEILQGVVSDLKLEELVAGEYGERVVYRATFSLGEDRKVRIQSWRRKACIRDGDLVAVVGTSRSFGLNALAYANLTTGKSDDTGRWELLFGGALLVAFSIWFAAGHVALLTAMAGVWSIYQSARIGLASRRVKTSQAAYSMHANLATGAPASDA